jgi:hypothetical protein
MTISLTPTPNFAQFLFELLTLNGTKCIEGTIDGRGQLRHLQSDFLHNLSFSVVWQRFFVLSVLSLSTFSAF